MRDANFPRSRRCTRARMSTATLGRRCSSEFLATRQTEQSPTSLVKGDRAFFLPNCAAEAEEVLLLVLKSGAVVCGEGFGRGGYWAGMEKLGRFDPKGAGARKGKPTSARGKGRLGPGNRSRPTGRGRKHGETWRIALGRSTSTEGGTECHCLWLREAGRPPGQGLCPGYLRDESRG
jgi:hypothetical protein